MTLKETIELLKEDLNANGGGFLKKFFFNHSFKIIFWFRVCQYLYIQHNPFRYILYVIYKHYEIKYGIQIGLNQTIKGGIRFPHFSGIVCGAKFIGRNLTMYQCTTIGSTHGKGAPVIGDNVILFAGAKVVGNIKIGNNVVVGANAVVTSDVPDNAIIVGNPGRVISLDSQKITKYFIRK